MSLSAKQWAEQAVPVAAILIFWNVLAVVAAEQGVGGSIRSAGIVMAALYVLLRGVALSSEVLPPATKNVIAVLFENARIAVPAGAWFLGAMVVYVADGFLFLYNPSETATALASAFAGAGLGVVGMYAVAAGYATLGDGDGDAVNGGRDATGGDRPASAESLREDGRSSDDGAATGGTAMDGTSTDA